VRFLLHRANPLSLELSHREWQDGDVQWLTGTHTSQGMRYFNQESHEELLWWIQVPALVAASPSAQRAAAQRSAAAVSQATQAAKDAGYRLERLLRGDSASVEGRAVPHTTGSAVKAAAAKRVDKAKSADSPDGAGAPADGKKSEKPKTKGAKKKSTPGDRKR
jgi:hypothetical protein